MPLETDTQHHQEKLAWFCRSDLYEPIPGVREDRVGTYRRLVFNVIEDTLTHAFPITRAALSDEEWRDLVHVFFEQHDSGSPLLWRMPHGLVEFSRQHGWAARLGRPFLDDLLRFEWMEIEVFMMPDASRPPARETGDPLRDPVIIHPDHRIETFRYPVFKRSPRDLELEQGEGRYILLAYRHPVALNVRFVELEQEMHELFLRLREGVPLGKILDAPLSHPASTSDKKQRKNQGVAFVQALLAGGAALGYGQ